MRLEVGTVTRRVEEIRAAMANAMPRATEELERLVRIPSVSADGHDPRHVRISAEASAEILSDAGLAGVRLLELDRAHPAVYGEMQAPPGAPTVLLYAHHDVVPVGEEDLWDTAPFEPVLKGGLMFGRGTADDKAAIAVHAAALRVLGDELGVGIRVFIEGEEEQGSPHLDQFLAQYGELLDSDAVVLADMENWGPGIPGLATSLRGLIDCVVEVSVLRFPVHSGAFGGPIADAISVLVATLATLYDRSGDVAVQGLVSGSPPSLEFPEDRLRSEAELEPSFRLIGTGSLAERLWTKPAISVLGIDAPSVVDAVNRLEPRARAKVSLRIAPGDDPERAMDALTRHLISNVPWGAEVTVTPGTMQPSCQVDTTGPIYDTMRWALGEGYGHEPVEIGSGSALPAVGRFASAMPEASLLLTGVTGYDCGAHAENERLNIEEFHQAALAEALFLFRLGQLVE
jgi:cysteinylglycine-S-conjugate dipeptidase